MLTILRYFILLLIFFGIGSYLYQHGQPEFRYAYDPCQKRLIFDRSIDLDFMALGGSRMMRGFQAEEFAKAVSEGGSKRVVYDLSRSGRSEFHYYIFLRDFYNQKRNVKNLIILFYEATNDRYHPHTHLVGTTTDLYEMIASDSSISWSEKLQDNLSLNMSRASYHLERAIKTPPKADPKGNRPITDETRDCSLDESGVEPELILEKDSKREEFYERNLNWNLHAVRNARVQNMIKKIIQLASEHGTQVYLALPSLFAHKTLSPDFIKSVEDTFHVPFLTPDQKTANELSKVENYTDVSHLTPEGSVLFSKWLAKEILKHEQNRK